MSTHPDITGGAAAPPPPEIATVRAALGKLRRAAAAAAATGEAGDSPTVEVSNPLDAIYRVVNSPRFVPFIDKRFFEFIAMHGRPPHSTDLPRPWRYRGYLLWVVFLAHQFHPAVSPRWPYYFRQIEAGRLLREPIPKISFDHHAESKTAYNHLEKIVQRLGNVFGTGERSLYLLLDWLAWSLGVDEEFPKDVDEETAEFLYRNVNLDHMLLHPSDVLGELLMELRGSAANWSGFFLTPHSVCECMSQIVFGLEPWKKALSRSVWEPAVGCGRMLLHASNYSLRLGGVDKDVACVKASRINGALWAPQLAFPLPIWYWGNSTSTMETGVHHADGLTNKIITHSPRTAPAEVMLPYAPPHRIIAFNRRAEEAEERARQERAAWAHSKGANPDELRRQRPEPARRSGAASRAAKEAPPDDAQASLFG